MSTQLDKQPLDFGAIVGKKPSGTRFILVRHGETDWNKERRFQGHTDISLNAHGLRQAKLVQRYFNQLEKTGLTLYQHCVASDLSRALITANTIHGDKFPGSFLNKNLRERHYGHLAGLTGDEMQAKSPDEFFGLRNRVPDAPLAGGETLRQFYERVVSAFQQIAVEQQGNSVLLVAHGGVLDCIYRHCTDEPLEKQRDWQLPNCALNLIELDSQGNCTNLLWAWTGHLSNDNTGQNMDEVDGRIV